MTRYAHIYLSPHCDDAALSCGASIHGQAHAGEAVLVITACTAPPALAPSPLAARLHAQMGAPAGVAATRAAEDRAAMVILGAAMHHLGIQDAIYRGEPGAWRYGSAVALFGVVHAADATLAGRIADAVAAHASPESVIHAPLGVGRHVDHQLGNQAGWLLHQRGHRVRFYEDFPYAEPGYVAPDRSLDAVVRDQVCPLAPELVPCSAKDVDARIRAVQAYASQLALVFGDPASVAPRIRAAAMRQGSDAPAERRWRPSGTRRQSPRRRVASRRFLPPRGPRADRLARRSARGLC